jgi:hypothetical protein
MGYYFKEKVRLVMFYLINDINLSIMDMSEKDKNNLIKWSIEMLPKFRETFDSLINNLD